MKIVVPSHSSNAFGAWPETECINIESISFPDRKFIAFAHASETVCLVGEPRNGHNGKPIKRYTLWTPENFLKWIT